MKLSNVNLIFSRELRDQLRDRRTLFTIAVLPIFLYPLLGMLLIQVTQFTRQHPANIWIVGSEFLPEDKPLIQGKHFAAELFQYPEDQNLLDVSRHDELSTGKGSSGSMPQVEQAVRTGDVDAVLIFPITFADQLERFRRRLSQAQRDDQEALINEVPKPRIFFDQARDNSRVARDRLAGVLYRWREEIGQTYLKENRIPLTATRPFETVVTDVAPETKLRAAVWSMILPFVVMIWALTGAFYPAIDLCAGEKERGTLETLLSSPARRSEIVGGKLLTIMFFSIMTALLNLASMGITAALMMGQLQQLEHTFPEIPLGLPPLISLIWLVIALIPMAALFSALSLALAALARSAKEGQYYLMPLLLVMMPLMVLPVLPSITLDAGTSLIPVTGLILLVRSLMESDYSTAMVYFLPVSCVTTICCLLAIRWAIDQFNNESVLFRESERLDLGLWIQHVVRDRGDTPTIGEALLCAAIILVLRFLSSFQLSMPENWNGIAVLTVITQIAFFATPALLMALILTRNVWATLLLRRPPLWAIPAAVSLAICLHPAVTMLSQYVQQIYPMPEAIEQMSQKLITQAPNIWVLLLVLAVTPAICEELAFRGFILSGLRHLGHRWWAIVLSSLFFGIAHGIIQQTITATIVGVIIGYLAIQTGSLFICILFHIAHNSTAIVVSTFHEEIFQHLPLRTWIFEEESNYSWPFVIVTLVCALLLLQWFRRLPHQLYAEEQLQAALDQQTVRAEG